MCALANEGQAFEIFSRTGVWNVPLYSLAFSALPAFIAFAAVKTSTNLVSPLSLSLLYPIPLSLLHPICLPVSSSSLSRFFEANMRCTILSREYWRQGFFSHGLLFALHIFVSTTRLNFNDRVLRFPLKQGRLCNLILRSMVLQCRPS